MPTNKEALIRYRVINRCLIDHKIVSKEKLIAACEDALDIYPIGKRTIDGDINAMRYDDRLGYHAPIKYDRFEGGYYYEDPDYSIDNFPINNDELQTLKFAASLLNQFKNVEIFRKFSGTVQKIIDAVNIRRFQQEEAELNFIDFEKVPFVKGSEYLETLIKAVKDKKVLTIIHRSFDSAEEHQYNIHPYLLKEYRNRWYLVGLNDHNKEIRTYGFDRIISINTNPDIAYIKSDFEPERYFKNTLGIIASPEEPPVIVLSFTKLQAQYLIAQPLHERQLIIEEDEEKVIISLKVHPTYELKSMILGWGRDVEVIEPKALRKEIISMLKGSLKTYEKG